MDKDIREVAYGLFILSIGILFLMVEKDKILSSGIIVLSLTIFILFNGLMLGFDYLFITIFEMHKLRKRLR